MRNESKYYLFLSLVYFAVSLVGILHHELWLDESHHWLLARDSTSLSNLINNTRFEGHPVLWNVLLFGITRLTYDLFWMQLLHILIATATVFLFLKKDYLLLKEGYADEPRLQRTIESFQKA